MSALADLHWLRPAWLLAWPLLPLLAWRLGRQRAGGAWSAHCDPALLAYLGVAGERDRRRLPMALLLLGWTLGVLAIAGPTWERVETPVQRSGTSRVVVLDLSQSMDAADVAPSRLARARFKTADLLARAADGRVGLVVFAGAAFALAPITEDVATLQNLLPPLETALMPVQGSRADLGIRRAAELLESAGVTGGDIVLVTDGAPPEAVDAARRAREAGHRVAVLAVGTASGAPVPLPDGGFLKDAAGRIVVPGVGGERLLDIAHAGGGRIAWLSADDSDIDRLLLPAVAGADDTERWQQTHQAWLDRGPWLLLAVLPLAALGFRRGWLVGVAALAVALPPAPVQAFEWSSLWARPDQRTQAELAAGDVERALEAAREAPPEWRASALYRAGRYEAAADVLAPLDDADAAYNRGNALARAGRLQEALAAYDRALAAQPDSADAVHNRALVEELLRRQEQQQREQQQPQDDAGEKQSSSAGNGEDGDQGGPPEDGSPSPTETSAGADGARDARDEAGDEAESAAARDGDGTAGGDDDQEAEQQADATPPASDGDAAGRDAAGEAAEAPADRQQATADPRIEQLLRRVPDDPGGLLRRKFALEYARRVRERETVTQPW